jgi:hypothetical protein
VAYVVDLAVRTLGMALLGVKVVAADGTGGRPAPRDGACPGVPLSFLLCGLGFTGIFCNEVAGLCTI